MSEAPSGFVERTVDGATLVLRDDVADALVGAGCARPESLRPRAHATYAGRGEPFGVDVPGAGAVFVRPYLHGGLLGKLTGDVHAGDGRFREELAVLAEARAAGVPVPEPLGIVSRSRRLGAGLFSHFIAFCFARFASCQLSRKIDCLRKMQTSLTIGCGKSWPSNSPRRFRR